MFTICRASLLPHRARLSLFFFLPPDLSSIRTCTAIISFAYRLRISLSAEISRAFRGLFSSSIAGVRWGLAPSTFVPNATHRLYQKTTVHAARRPYTYTKFFSPPPLLAIILSRFGIHTGEHTRY